MTRKQYGLFGRERKYLENVTVLNGKHFSTPRNIRFKGLKNKDDKMNVSFNKHDIYLMFFTFVTIISGIIAYTFLNAPPVFFILGWFQYILGYNTGIKHTK